MKYVLVALLALISTIKASAQKHNLYADGGLCLAYNDPGFSATYNYNFIKYIGIGAGVQGYAFHPAATNIRHFTPAVFADLRFRIRPEKISQYFAFVDVGYNFYKHNNDSLQEGNFIYSVPQDNGIYGGLGIGYFLRLTHRGWGPYATVKLISNNCKVDQRNILTNEKGSQHQTRSTLVISLGFRFGDDVNDLVKY
jgi:hypothetical protein